MSDFLAAMAASSRLRARETRTSVGEASLRSRARMSRPPAPIDLSVDGFDLIAETKLASPRDGILVHGDDRTGSVLELAVRLGESGCVALSVLTEPDAFGGALEHLEAVSGATGIPVMRKDFLVDPIQVLEARAAGASGVLLIARMVQVPLLVDMVDLALDLGMFVLIEIFTPEDLEAAAAVFDRDVLVGVNARDLATLEIDPSRHRNLAPLLPSHLPAVAESGITTGDDAAAARAAGYRLALVGTTLSTSPDPSGTARRILAAGRAAAVGGRSP